MIDVEVTLRDESYEDILSSEICKDIINKAYALILLNSNKAVYLDNYDNIVLSVLITNDKEMETLNNSYRGIANTTDVLSFAFNDDCSDKNIHFPIKELGEIIISYPCLLRNAGDINESKEIEAKRLLIHGFLHLLGYNHLTNDFEKEDMLVLQEKLLKEIEG